MLLKCLGATLMHGSQWAVYTQLYSDQECRVSRRELLTGFAENPSLNGTFGEA